VTRVSRTGPVVEQADDWGHVEFPQSLQALVMPAPVPASAVVAIHMLP